jgi:hypothetical protein
MKLPIQTGRSALVAVTLALCLVSAEAYCGDVYVISNTALNISPDDIKDIYTGEKLVEGGVKLIPIDNNSIKPDFLEKVVHVAPAKYSAMWAKKVFQDGLAVPLSKGTDADVIALVKAKPGNIGYVSNPTPDVLVIKKF